MRYGAVYLLLATLLPVIPASLTAADAGLRGYLERHCFDCHDSTTKKGGLNLEALPIQFDAAERFNVWAHVHDRIGAGEMPPKSRDRPAEKENADVLKLLDGWLHDADAARIAKTGRALFRRLSAQEYENALRDLLHLPSLRIKQLLPEDGRRHGYNKIGQALDLSNVHPRRLLRPRISCGSSQRQENSTSSRPWFLRRSRRPACKRCVRWRTSRAHRAGLQRSAAGKLAANSDAQQGRLRERNGGAAHGQFHHGRCVGRCCEVAG